MEYKCTICGGKIIKEGNTDIYFCENCHAMISKGSEGKYEIRKGQQIVNNIS